MMVFPLTPNIPRLSSLSPVVPIDGVFSPYLNWAYLRNSEKFNDFWIFHTRTVESPGQDSHIPVVETNREEV
ncbi:hypothetical protein L6452_06467 [Arctium lappa]|uniref:Uncharacterized protein n=1 Tax=Arctium lappa TaxID=4217 RepID=A0ACB9EIZ2_ARCLA|nr:hypothetical protein L6452_06467 [Arctium lappa]